MQKNADKRSQKKQWDAVRILWIIHEGFEEFNNRTLSTGHEALTASRPLAAYSKHAPSSQNLKNHKKLGPCPICSKFLNVSHLPVDLYRRRRIANNDMFNKTILKAELDERIIGHVTAVDGAFNQFADNYRYTTIQPIKNFIAWLRRILRFEGLSLYPVDITQEAFMRKVEIHLILSRCIPLEVWAYKAWTHIIAFYLDVERNHTRRYICKNDLLTQIKTKEFTPC